MRYHDGHQIIHEDDMELLRIRKSSLDRLLSVLRSVDLLHDALVLEQRLQNLAVRCDV